MPRCPVPFFRIFREIGTLKINKKFTPWKKVLKFFRHVGMFFLSMCAKNRAKIPFLGPNFALMSPQKKGIYLGNSGFCI